MKQIPLYYWANKSTLRVKSSTIKVAHHKVQKNMDIF